MELSKKFNECCLLSREIYSTRKSRIFVTKYKENNAIIKQVSCKNRPAPTLEHNEYRILKEISHPNLICVLDFETNLEHDFIVLERMEGNLREYQTYKGKFFESEEAFDYLTQVTSVIQYLHKNDIIHRDLKSENLLIHPTQKSSGGFRFLKLGDFADSVKTDEAHLCTELRGTADFISPSLVNGIRNQRIKVCKEDDLWALGICYYDWLVGESPFYKATRKLTYKAIECEKWKVEEYFTEFEILIISKLLEKDETKRINIDNLLNLIFVKKSLFVT